ISETAPNPAQGATPGDLGDRPKPRSARDAWRSRRPPQTPCRARRLVIFGEGRGHDGLALLCHARPRPYPAAAAPSCDVLAEGVRHVQRMLTTTFHVLAAPMPTTL